MNYENNIKKDFENLHVIPEIAFHEFETQEYIKQRLIEHGIEFTEMQPTGILVYFDNGSTSTVAIRAEMDALEIVEDKNHEIRSENGFMHACGHDGHLSILLNLCIFFKFNKRTKNILCIFQPSEEQYGGSKLVIENIKKYKIEMIYTMHLWPKLKAGKIYYKKGPLLASSTEINIYIKGVQTHIGSFREGVDAFRIATKFIRLKISRGIFNIGVIKSKGARNIIPGDACLQGSLRVFDEKKRVHFIKKINKLAKNLSNKFHANITIDSKNYLPLIANSHIYDNYLKIKTKFFQSDDFGEYKKIAPICYFLLGTGTDFPLHNPSFIVNEKVLYSGFYFYINLIK